MRKDPLAQPRRDSPLHAAFLSRFELERGEPDAASLEAIGRAFSRLPYENLTKIIKLNREGSAERALRHPGEVLGDHLRWSTGGTCFSLTALLLHLVRAHGFEAEPVLADRPYGPDTHCAVLVKLAGRPHLIDPGYLIFKPVPIGGAPIDRIPTPFNEVVLKAERGDRLALSTVQSGSETHRLTFKLPAADPTEFMRAWHESFGWDMMRYPLLTACRGGKQLYLQSTHYQERQREGVERRKLEPDRLPELIATRFGVASDIVAKALEIVARAEGSLDRA